MYQGNASHTGYVPVTLDPAVFAERYLKKLDTYGLNPVVCAGSWVYASTYTEEARKLFGLSARTGEAVWTQEFDFGDLNSPSYADGKVFVATNDSYAHNFFALDYKTGNRAYQVDYYHVGGERQYGPTVYEDGLYLVGHGYVHSFSTVAVNLRWMNYVGSEDEWTPAVDDQHVYAYGNNCPTEPLIGPGLAVLDRQTGALDLAIPDPNYGETTQENQAPVIGSRGNIIVVNSGYWYPGRLVSFDLAGRSINYEITQDFRGQVTLAGGAIYVFNGNRVEARNEADGALLWSWDPPVQDPPVYLWGTMIATDNLLFVSCQSEYAGTQLPWTGVTCAVDLNTHQTVWSYPQGGSLALSALGTLFIANQHGELAAVKVR